MKAGKCFNIGMAGSLTSFGSIAPIMSVLSASMAAEPHCVCRMCQGQGCKACHGRGWQTEEEYKRNPKEFKAEEVR